MNYMNISAVIIEPHELELFKPRLAELLPEDVLITLLAEKAVEHEGRRYVIRPVARRGRIDPGAWAAAAKTK